MENRNSIIWLTVFLCFVVLGLGWLSISGRYKKEVNLLNEEIQKLNQEIENLKKTKEPILLSSPSPTSTSSAEPSPVSTSSSFLTPPTNTNSGCQTCGE